MKKKNLPTTKQYKTFAIESIKSIDADSQTIKGIVASDGGVDRHGESINPNGWKINGHVPLLWGHNYNELPVGKTTSEYVEDGKLIVDGRISKKYGFAQDLFALVEEGIVDKVSVGFIPLRFDDTGEFTYAETELLEVSFVNVPANPRAGVKDIDARVKAIEAGLKELLEKKDEEPEEVEGTESPEEVENDDNEASSDVDTPEVESSDSEDVEASVDDQEKSITLTKEELQAMIDESIKQALEKESKPVEKPSEAIASLLEVRDELRKQYTGTSKVLENINKLLRKES